MTLTARLMSLDEKIWEEMRGGDTDRGLCREIIKEDHMSEHELQV